jgi:YD repeat-containing protein
MLFYGITTRNWLKVGIALLVTVILCLTSCKNPEEVNPATIKGNTTLATSGCMLDSSYNNETFGSNIRTVTFTYTFNNGKITSYVDNNGIVTNITYNANGKVSSMISNQKTQTYTYDANGRLANVKANDGTSSTYTYNSDGTITVNSTYIESLISYYSNDTQTLLRTIISNYTYQNGKIIKIIHYYNDGISIIDISNYLWDGYNLVSESVSYYSGNIIISKSIYTYSNYDANYNPKSFMYNYMLNNVSNYAMEIVSENNYQKITGSFVSYSNGKANEPENISTTDVLITADNKKNVTKWISTYTNITRTTDNTYSYTNTYSWNCN